MNSLFGVGSVLHCGRSEDHVTNRSTIKQLQPTKFKKTDIPMIQLFFAVFMVIMAILMVKVAGEAPPTVLDNNYQMDAKTQNEGRNQMSERYLEINSTGFVKVNPTEETTTRRQISNAHTVRVDDINDLSTETLRRHNQYRKRHNVRPLKLSSEISKVSQDWANQLAKTNTFRHRPNNKYGENLYMISSSRPVSQVGIKAVDAWYNEKKYFNFQGTEEQMEASFKKTGHLTQVLWKNSKILGVGIAKDGSGSVYVVCNYDPPGNVIGSFKENVLPPKNS